MPHRQARRFLRRLRPFLFLPLASQLLVAASSPQYLFNRVDFPTGNFPSGVAVGDFNNDGRPDVAVSNRLDNSVSIFLGQQNGTLEPKADFSVGTYPWGLAVADFNNDGKLDVAVTSACGVTCGVVSILLGNGDGTFASHVDYATGAGPMTLVAADFNSDGFFDLAIVDDCGTTCGLVSILLGKGDGTFQAKNDYPVGQGPYGIVVQDLNRDGKPDLAVANTSNTISILLGNGDGTFQPHQDIASDNAPAAVAAGDFDGDKITDLVVSHTGAPWVLTLMKGNGDGTFQPEQQINSVNTYDTNNLIVIDLNHDGKLDIALTDVSQGGVVVFLGNGDGTFQAQVTYAATRGYPFAFAVQDINGDGNLDCVVADQEFNDLTILLGNGDGTFSPRKSLPPGPVLIEQTAAIAAAVADFNGDGIPDLAIAEGNVSYNDGGISVLLGKGKGLFQAPVYTNSNGALGVIAAADFNKDGRPDVAVPNGNGAAVLLGNGDGTFGAFLQVVATSAITARSLVTGDFNNDGNQDLVVVANGFLISQPIYVLLGNGDGTFEPAKQFWSSTSIPQEIAAADFNHDGKLDLVVNLNPNGIAVMLGNGDGTFQNPVTYATDELPTGLTVADLNGDGIPDIVATGSQIDVFIGKGDGTFANEVSYDGGNFPWHVIAADINGDGKVDIVASAEGTGAIGAIEILLGNADGTFQPPVEIASGSFGRIAAGDLNQDGIADIFTWGLPGAIFLSGPVATISPSYLNFGAVGPSGNSPAHSLILSNSGNGPLELSGISVSPPFATTDTCGNSVALLSSCAISVTFTPNTSGNLTGNVSVVDNAPQGHQTVPLFGTGVVDFSITPASTSMTMQAGGQATDVMTFAGIGGSFGNAIQLTCTVSGQKPLPACSMSSLSVTPGAHSVTSTLTVTAPTTTAVQWPVGTRRSAFFLLAAFAPLMFGMCFVNRLQPRLQMHAILFALFLFLIVGSACGGSNTAGSGNTGPSGLAYTVTVTATSGTINHTAQVAVTVN
jgi:FG-GAP-like repeat